MTRFENITAALFDLDGTLVEHAMTWEDICRATFDEFVHELRPVTQDQFWEAYSAKADELWALMLDGSFPNNGPRSVGLLHALRRLGADERLAEPMLRSRDRRLLESGRLYDDAAPVLRRLRAAGLKTGIVTNGYTSTQRMKIEYYGLESLVDFVVISQEAGCHKPDKAIFELALSLAGAAAEHAVFVGDTLETDIRGALNTGIRPVLFDPARTRDGTIEHGGAELRVARVGRLTELLHALRLDEVRA